jgi:hypothetical protein
MYGLETDPKKTLFNLINNQIRDDSIINNAGWYDKDGNRLGCGDISYLDIKKISASLQNDEEFIVLTEANSIWNLPSYLDRSCPGRDYVIQNATFYIGKINNSLHVFRPKQEMKDKAPEEYTSKNGIKITKISYKDFFSKISYNKPKKIKEQEKQVDMSALKKEIIDVLNTPYFPKKKPTQSNIVWASPSIGGAITGTVGGKTTTPAVSGSNKKQSFTTKVASPTIKK